MPILGIVASSNYQRVAPDTGAMFPLGMVQVGSGGTSTITFSSIPNTYKHLQIRALARANRAGSTDSVVMRFNSDSGNNYAHHWLYGDGASALAANTTSTNYIYPTVTTAASDLANTFTVTVIDILDYASTSKNKVTRTLAGYDVNGAGGLIFLSSGLWMNNTTAINTITITPGSSNWAQYSQFALYGIKGA